MTPLVLANYNLTLEHLFRKSPKILAGQYLKRSVRLKYAGTLSPISGLEAESFKFHEEGKDLTTVLQK